MPDKFKALFRGPTTPDGTPQAWLDREPGTAAFVDAEGKEQPATPEESGIPARHLTQEEYDALSPRNKERVREAKHNGEPLYEVRGERDMAPAVPAPAAAAAKAAPATEGKS